MIVGLAGRVHSGKDSVGRALIEQLGFKRVAFADGVRGLVAEIFGWPADFVQSDDFKARVVIGAMADGGPCEITGRGILQRTGTGVRKVLGEDAWIKLALAKCKGNGHHYVAGPDGRCAAVLLPSAGLRCGYVKDAPFHSTTHYVITDVRFPNEHAAIKAAGGKVIRLNRADRVGVHDFLLLSNPTRCGFIFADDTTCGLPRAAHPSHYSGDTHESETSLPDESNETIKYDYVVTGELESNVAGAVGVVRGWLGQ